MRGMAPDGGLYIPVSVPILPPSVLEEEEFTFQSLALEIFTRFIAESEIPKEDLASIISRSFSSNFDTQSITPLHKLTDSTLVLELWHGPTFAFKDIALQLLGNLFEYFIQRRHEPTTITIVGATSGDTGSAAIYGLRGKKNINVFILFPRGRVSVFQEKQMTSVLDENVHCIKVDGTFDDCQVLVVPNDIEHCKITICRPRIQH